MAFFKFRTAGEGGSAPRQPESIEAMRRRARHRLIGATVLVLAGIVGFPLLFDTQPRPIPVDIPIEIPDRNKAAPLPVPARPAPSAPVASGKVSPARGVAGTAGVAPVPVTPAPAPKAEAPAPAPAKPEAVAAPKPESAPAPAPAPAPKSESKQAVKPEPPADATRAKALLEGKPAAEAAADGRFVVQVGAFADPDKAREARARLERAGLKTYTHVAETKAGKRIRVRVGPFPSRADADKAASKIKGLDMPAAILTL